jgi:hypothetical protein
MTVDEAALAIEVAVDDPARLRELEASVEVDKDLGPDREWLRGRIERYLGHFPQR